MQLYNEVIMNKVYQLFSNKRIMLYFAIALHFCMICNLFLPNISSDIYGELHLICLTILISLLYFVTLLNFSDGQLKFYTVLTLIAFIVQFQFGMLSESLFGLLNAFILYVFMYSSFYILTLGQIHVFRELFQVTFLLVVVTAVSDIAHLALYDILSIFSLFFMYTLPLVGCLLYHKEMKQLFFKQRCNIYIFALWELLSYVFFAFLPLAAMIGGEYLELVMYGSNIAILLILHFRIVLKILSQKLKSLKSLYFRTALKLVLIMVTFFVTIGFILRFDFEASCLFMNMIIMMFALCFFQVSQIVKHEQFDTEQFRAVFLKKNKIVQELLEEENQKNQFSEFLHNEILQNVIAVKNFNKHGEKLEFRKQIEEVSEDLIKIIRNKMDYYQSNIDNNRNLYDSYNNLIDKIIKNLYSEKIINRTIDVDIVLPAPYDKIIYHFIEELVTNALKYSSSSVISLKLRIVNQTIYLTIENATQSFNNEKGFGITFIRNQVEALGGCMTIEQDKYFKVNILLDIDKELCYETFIN